MTHPGRHLALAALLLIGAVLTSCTHRTAGHPVVGPDRSVVTTTTEPPTTVSPEPPPAPSDEDQIRQTIQAFQDAYNSEDWDAYRALMCPAMQDQFTGEAMDMVQQTRAENGPTEATVTEVSIDGDSAEATIDGRNESTGSATFTLPLQRSDGWKVCRLS